MDVDQILREADLSRIWNARVAGSSIDPTRVWWACITSTCIDACIDASIEPGVAPCIGAGVASPVESSVTTRVPRTGVAARVARESSVD